MHIYRFLGSPCLDRGEVCWFERSGVGFLESRERVARARDTAQVFSYPNDEEDLLNVSIGNIFI